MFDIDLASLLISTPCTASLSAISTKDLYSPCSMSAAMVATSA